MSPLFTPLALREVTFDNRAWVSPMCMYSAAAGVIGDWHLAHLGGIALGRPGLVMAEATAVEPAGRISTGCPGIWNDEQAVAWKRVVGLVHDIGARIGLQLAHAGRKASTTPPWEGGGVVGPQEGGWESVAPSPLAFGELPVPRELTAPQIAEIIAAWGQAAARAGAAGFDVVEVHMGHGYLLHEFLSPLSNQRTDAFGGSLANRMRMPLAVARTVREHFPAERPVFVRISSTDWVAGGWDVESSIELAFRLREAGIDLIDASSGGLDPAQRIPRTADFQVANAATIRAATGMPVAGVGLITSAAQAEDILSKGQADAVFLARAILRDPHWPLRAAQELGARVVWPPQYARGLPWR
ncbi:MAG: NADH:flavin oxidoreductase/NADH oxidase [Candidatus Nanopelagicales bacterium]